MNFEHFVKYFFLDNDVYHKNLGYEKRNYSGVAKKRQNDYGQNYFKKYLFKYCCKYDLI